jgi:hypothetical protein
MRGLRARLGALALSAVLLAAGAARAEDTHLQQLLDRLPPERRAEVEAAIEKLAPEQRELLLKRYEELDPDQRALIERAATGQPAVDPLEARANRQLDNEARWRALSESEREAYRQQLRDFQELSADEQEALVETHFVRRGPDKRREVLNRLQAAPPQR